MIDLIGRPLLPRIDKMRHVLASVRTSLDAEERATLDAVCAQYGYERLHRFRRMDSGQRGNSFVVSLGQGRRIVVTRYKSTLTRPAIDYEHSILLHLQSAGVRAPRLIRNRDGDTVTAWQGRQYAVFGYVPGFRYTEFFVAEKTRLQYIARAGEALAAYHRSVDGFVPSGRKQDGYRPDGRERWITTDEQQEALQRAEARLTALSDRSRAHAALRRALPALRAELADLEDQFASVEATLHKLPVHGDFGPFNMLCLRTGDVLMLDFECARLDLRAYDVVFSMVAFARWRSTLDIDQARAFFRAYQAIYPLPEREVPYLPTVFRTVQLRALARTVELELTGTAQSVTRTLSRLQWVKWMASHGETLLAAL